MQAYEEELKAREEDAEARPFHAGCERSVKIKLKIKKTYFENKNNTILKIEDLAANIKWFSSNFKPFGKMLHFGKIPKIFWLNLAKIQQKKIQQNLAKKIYTCSDFQTKNWA